MFLWMNVFTLSVGLVWDSQRHERLLRIRYWFTSNHIPFRFGCRPREASRLEAKTHEAEARTHEAEAEATTHEAEAEAEATFFGLEAEARPRGLTSLVQTRWNKMFIQKKTANEAAGPIKSTTSSSITRRWRENWEKFPSSTPL